MKLETGPFDVAVHMALGDMIDGSEAFDRPK